MCTIYIYMSNGCRSRHSTCEYVCVRSCINKCVWDVFHCCALFFSIFTTSLALYTCISYSIRMAFRILCLPMLKSFYAYAQNKNDKACVLHIYTYTNARSLSCVQEGNNENITGHYTHIWLIQSIPLWNVNSTASAFMSMRSSRYSNIQ